MKVFALGLERIREYGLEHGVRIEHYIISSGLKEMIEGTEMAERGSFHQNLCQCIHVRRQRRSSMACTSH